jgi:hypothetical protein
MAGGDIVASAEGTYCCAVDSDPRFHLDALRWFATLTEVAEVPARQLVVHAVRDARSDVLEYLRGRGVSVRVIEQFDERSRHCNKISGALALAGSGACNSYVVLTDTDVAIAKDPLLVGADSQAVRGKIVDGPNPPLDVLRSVFESAGLPLPEIIEPDFDHSDRTIVGNLNGGLYIVPGKMLPTLAEAWERWARWLLGHGVLGRYAFHTDQVAMAMALADEEIGTLAVAREWNFPTHVPEWVRADARAPGIVHYHGRVDPTGLISTTGSPCVDVVIAELNRAIAKVWHDAFPNATFWDWRYKTNPDLGSGVGSRGEPLRGKRRLLREVLTRVRPSSVLDVGCGDGEATRDLPLNGYTGLDVSEEALSVARQKRPDGNLFLSTVVDWPGVAELTICLDVLIHQADAAEYRQTVEGLLHATTRVLLVSGYEEPPSGDSPMIHFHEPLSSSIEQADPGVRSYKLREEHEITTLAIVKPPFERNWPAR